MSAVLEKRVSNLEQVLADFIRNTELGFTKVNNAITDLKNEMSDFKDEMSDYKRHANAQINSLNKKWGDLSNRLGTLAEDFAAPNIPVIARKHFGCQEKPRDLIIRRISLIDNDPDTEREFDVIAVYPEMVFINETKSTAKPQHVDEFLETVAVFFDYYPEYRGRQLIPVFASLSMHESIVTRFTKKKIYVMTLKGDTMDLLNYEQLQRKK